MALMKWVVPMFMDRMSNVGTLVESMTFLMAEQMPLVTSVVVGLLLLPMIFTWPSTAAARAASVFVPPVRTHGLD
jgi:hypothetical protein